MPRARHPGRHRVACGISVFIGIQAADPSAVRAATNTYKGAIPSGVPIVRGSRGFENRLDTAAAYYVASGSRCCPDPDGWRWLRCSSDPLRVPLTSGWLATRALSSAVTVATAGSKTPLASRGISAASPPNVADANSSTVLAT